MKYFAKYLPVEGEIKEGDIVRTTRGSDSIHRLSNPANKEGIESMNKSGMFQKVQLVLCSRDVQVGDTYMEYDTLEEFRHHEVNLLHPKDFKVIGEISPEAIWVKEGDEFDEDDIEKGGGCILYYANPNFWSKEYKKGYTDIVKLKCSQCNTFH